MSLFFSLDPHESLSFNATRLQFSGAVKDPAVPALPGAGYGCHVVPFTVNFRFVKYGEYSFAAGKFAFLDLIVFDLETTVIAG